MSTRFTAGNTAAAKLILADVERYGGEQSLMVQWARMTVRDTEGQDRPESFELTPPASGNARCEAFTRGVR